MYWKLFCDAPAYFLRIYKEKWVMYWNISRAARAYFLRIYKEKWVMYWNISALRAPISQDVIKKNEWYIENFSTLRAPISWEYIKKMGDMFLNFPRCARLMWGTWCKMTMFKRKTALDGYTIFHGGRCDAKWRFSNVKNGFGGYIFYTTVFLLWNKFGFIIEGFKLHFKNTNSQQLYVT